MILEKYLKLMVIHLMKGTSCNEIFSFSKFITSQNTNVLFAVVGSIEDIRVWNKKNIPNYVEIFIKSDLKKLLNLRKKIIS